MEFKKEDENYIYNVIGRNVKKYRKEKKINSSSVSRTNGLLIIIYS